MAHISFPLNVFVAPLENGPHVNVPDGTAM
jgi:hypothetical protein